MAIAFCRSFAHFLHNDQEKHRSVRLGIVSNVIQNWSVYEPFIIGDESYGKRIIDKSSYKSYMSGNGVYGGEVELQSFANIHNIHVLVYVWNDGTPREFRPNCHNKLVLLLSGVLDKGHSDIIECHNSTFWNDSEDTDKVKNMKEDQSDKKREKDIAKNMNVEQLEKKMQKDILQPILRNLSTSGQHSFEILRPCDETGGISTSRIKSPAERMKEYRARQRVKSNRVKSPAKRSREYRARLTSHIKPSTQRVREYRRKRKHKTQSEFIEDKVAPEFNNPTISPVKSSVERMKKYRKRRRESQIVSSSPTPQITSAALRMREHRKRRHDINQTTTVPLSEVEIARRAVQPYIMTKRVIDREEQHPKSRNYTLPPAIKTVYDLRIADRFGSICSCCDRMWFESELKPLSEAAQNFSTEQQLQPLTQACSHCKSHLEKLEIPPMAVINGFRYPIPDHLPSMNPMLERVVSPRLPFMQIRHLQRPLLGQFASVGSVINISVNVNDMVRAIPRLLSDDQVVNIHLKRKLVHKSTCMSGLVTRCDLLKWCNFLVQQPLYKAHHVELNGEALLGVPVTLEDLRKGVKSEDLTAKKPTTPLIDDNDKITNAMQDHELDELLQENEPDYHTEQSHQQTTMMWNEDMALAIAPAQDKRPVGLGFDEDAEELSFPGIYLGEKREFVTRKPPKAFEIANNEIKRSDQRGVRPDH